jgi:hypothetical protein
MRKGITLCQKWEKTSTRTLIGKPPTSVRKETNRETRIIIKWNTCRLRNANWIFFCLGWDPIVDVYCNGDGLLNSWIVEYLQTIQGMSCTRYCVWVRACVLASFLCHLQEQILRRHTHVLVKSTHYTKKQLPSWREGALCFGSGRIVTFETSRNVLLFCMISSLHASYI